MLKPYVEPIARKTEKEELISAGNDREFHGSYCVNQQAGSTVPQATDDYAGKIHCIE
jgi:hypothetical protein